MRMMEKTAANSPVSGVIENPGLIVPGSFGSLNSPDWREPDSHKWLVENTDLVASDKRFDDIAEIYKDLYGKDARRYGAAFHIRDLYRQLYGYAVPTPEALDVVGRYSPKGVIEVGAGNGYWAYLLRSKGYDVLAYDSHLVEGGENSYWKWDFTKYRGQPEEEFLDPKFQASWTTVLPGEAGVSEHYPDRALMLAWPPYQTPMASKALKCYTGDTLIYIGEGGSGCTGDETFHICLRAWENVETIEIPQFYGSNDVLEVYKR